LLTPGSGTAADVTLYSFFVPLRGPTYRPSHSEQLTYFDF